jgi:glycosyltransferase involved in cell wall biosynthesis
MPVTIFIQTLNEQDNLPDLLDSVIGFDDIVVLDSLSTDRTKQIALEHGCRWYERPYDGRGPHQNWAMTNIDWPNKWVFYLDADERMTPELRDEILAIADAPDEDRVAFYCGRKNYFRGRWIRHAMPPGLIMRFFQPPHIRFQRLANPVPIVDGKIGYLHNRFIHYNFSKGLEEWLDRHNRYSTYEAAETLKALRDNPLRWRNLFSTDPAKRRYELKNLSFRLPCRPLWKFLYLYAIKGGFLDAGPGLTYCTLQAIYEYHITLKVRQLKRMQRGLPGT